MQFQDVEEKKLKDLLTFPCDFTFKVVGKTRDDLAKDVETETAKLADIKGKVETKASGRGNYLAVSISIWAENIDQIEELYKNLAQIKGVRMVL